MAENHIRILCSVIKVDLVYEAPDGSLVAFFDSIQDSPLMQCARVRDALRSGIAGQSAPFLLREKDGVYFAALHAGEGFLYMGPMCSERLRASKRRQMCTLYGIEHEEARLLPCFTLPEIRNMILLTNSALKNGNLENEELMQLNQLISLSERGIRTDQVQFVLKEEAENDDASYRHSYHEEQLLMQAIREGRTEDAIRLAESMDRDSGRLSRTEVSHRRNLAIIGISLCARAAIDGGISPEEGYRLSGYYIQKCDSSQDPAHLLHYRNRAIEELTVRVKQKLEKPRTSSHVERAKDYVRKHYREKIYLDDIADSIGISPTHLSKLFKKETGQCLQDYINEERVFRAANLLMYSELSLMEIAEYVHFPSQSYFGKIFKQFKGVSPRIFRDQYRAREITEH
ncbi:MAG: helix-turn-helix transcriptional regulator [Lachnospiraceae bacterium]|nr:helix-turn-helix transcriptional regulator [Lachnospiraceae bacterium]